MAMNNFHDILKNTETACLLCERDFSHSELIEIIRTENDLEKQICLLKLKEIRSQDEADLLVFNLTNHHGIIREAAAIKINELMKMPENSAFFRTEKILLTFLDAVIDINPNICRHIIEILPFIENKKFFFKNLIKRALEIIEDAKTMNRRKSGYIYSRKVFKIFWYLEAVAGLGYFEDEKAILELINRTFDFDDYTIREKCAGLVAVFPKTPQNLRNALENDENYFVRRKLI